MTELKYGNSAIVHATKKKGMGVIGKFFAYTFAACGMILASLLFLTIIGIIPAIPLFFGSLGLIYAVQGRQQLECATCKKKQPVMKSREHFECIKCKNANVIEWS